MEDDVIIFCICIQSKHSYVIFLHRDFIFSTGAHKLCSQHGSDLTGVIGSICFIEKYTTDGVCMLNLQFIAEKTAKKNMFVMIFCTYHLLEIKSLEMGSNQDYNCAYISSRTA